MQQTILMTINEFKRMFKSWKIYIAFLCFIGLCFAMKKEMGCTGAFYSIDIMLGLNNTFFLLTLFAALPTSCTFSDDWENGYYKYVVSRSSSNKYIMYKILLCGISTFLITFISICIFGFSVYFLEGNHVNVFQAEVGFYHLIHSNYSLFYIVVRAFLAALVSIVYSEYALAASALFPNRFVATSLPLVVSIMIREFSYGGDYSFYLIEGAGPIYYQSPISSILYSILIVMAYAIVANIIFYWVVKRRIRCEIV